jgi:hypothetical protein
MNSHKLTSSNTNGDITITCQPICDVKAICHKGKHKLRGQEAVTITNPTVTSSIFKRKRVKTLSAHTQVYLKGDQSGVSWHSKREISTIILLLFNISMDFFYNPV